jgi:hypothetical protein
MNVLNRRQFLAAAAGGLGVAAIGPTWAASQADGRPARLSLEGISGLTVWADVGTTAVGETAAETLLFLRPGRPAVVGRQRGGEVPYLDPAYTPTDLLPDTGQSVLTRTGFHDMAVSRGHFLLQADPAGVLLLNGVPQRGGGVRPPGNGTRLLDPESRPLGKGEEYLIPSGGSVRIELPNGTRVLIRAG